MTTVYTKAKLFVGSQILVAVLLQPSGIAGTAAGSIITPEPGIPMTTTTPYAHMSMGSIIENTQEGARGRGNAKTRGSVQQLELITMESISSEDRVYILNTPLVCEVQTNGKAWIITCQEFDLFGYAPSRSEAEEQVQEQFAFLYDGLVDEDSSSLTLDAIELRNRLSERVAEVRQIHANV